MVLNEKQILVVDDDKHILVSLKVLLEPEFGDIITTQNPTDIPDILKENDISVVLLDMNFSIGETSGSEGINWLKEIVKYDSDINVILITAYGDLNLAVSALKYGAIDFIVKPWNNEKLLTTVNSVLQLNKNKREVKKLKSKQKALINALEGDIPELIGNSPKMKELKELIRKVAQSEANVLINGENGTGKELVAKTIHRNSKRYNNAFIQIDLGAINENLFESELFGYKKGAFTDAKTDRIGRLEAGNDGTVFLDEIGNLPLNQQSKLLSAIQNKEIYPLGDNNPVKIDIRFICATNISLNDMVNQQLFRQDLLYRINTVEITIPPLREREEDIPLLANYFIEKLCRKYRRSVIKLPDYVERKLQKYNWPGNIRELQHSIERAIILTSDNVFKSSDFDFLDGSDLYKNPFDNYYLDDIEKWAVENCLKKHSGNVTKAAEELGLTRGALYRRIEKYGL